MFGLDRLSCILRTINFDWEITMIRVAIAGVAGRMGRTLIEAINGSDQDICVAVGTVLADDPALGVDVGVLAGAPAQGVITSVNLSESLDSFDVLIDFTSPEAVLQHALICQKNGKAMVIGTTGLSEQDKAQVALAAKDIAIVMAPNMSVGVNLALKLIEAAAQTLGDDVDVEIVEAHHRFKKDAPSGTALRMGEVVAKVLDRDLEKVAVYGREGMGEERDRKTIGFATIRAGDIVGEHTVIFAGMGERLEITHKASSRMTFASGAVRAAGWVNSKSAGLYSMNDVLSL